MLASLSIAIEGLASVRDAIEGLAKEAEPKKEGPPPPKAPEVVAEEFESELVDDEEMVALDDEQPRAQKKAKSSHAPKPKVVLDGKLSFSFEGTVSVRE